MKIDQYLDHKRIFDEERLISSLGRDFHNLSYLSDLQLKEIVDSQVSFAINQLMRSGVIAREQVKDCFDIFHTEQKISEHLELLKLTILDGQKKRLLSIKFEQSKGV